MRFAFYFLFALVAVLFSHVTRVDIYTDLDLFSLASIFLVYVSEGKNS